MAHPGETDPPDEPRPRSPVGTVALATAGVAFMVTCSFALSSQAGSRVSPRESPSPPVCGPPRQAEGVSTPGAQAPGGGGPPGDAPDPGARAAGAPGNCQTAN